MVPSCNTYMAYHLPLKCPRHAWYLYQFQSNNNNGKYCADFTIVRRSSIRCDVSWLPINYITSHADFKTNILVIFFIGWHSLFIHIDLLLLMCHIGQPTLDNCKACLVFLGIKPWLRGAYSLSSSHNLIYCLLVYSTAKWHQLLKSVIQHSLITMHTCSLLCTVVLPSITMTS